MEITMGREAECKCDWNGTSAMVKALVEPPELILRGGLKQRIPFAEMQHLRADGDHLRFKFRGETVALTLGIALAGRWLKALTAPPPTLAKKLGITAETVVRMIGPADDPVLTEALAAARAATGPADLILARVDTPAELTRALKAAAEQLDRGVPIWFIYPKGKGHPLNGNDVRSTALVTGIVDTKVAAVSSTLTGLRFVKRRTTTSV